MFESPSSFITLPEHIVSLGYDMSYFMFCPPSRDLLSDTLINHTTKCFMLYEKAFTHSRQVCSETHYLNGDGENVKEMRENVIRLFRSGYEESIALGVQLLESGGCSWNWFDEIIPLRVFSDLSIGTWLSTMCYVCKMDTIEVYHFSHDHFAVLDYICFRNFVKKVYMFSISVKNLYFQVNIFHSQQIVQLLGVVGRFDTPLRIMFNVSDSLLDDVIQEEINKFRINAPYRMYLLETTDFKQKYILLKHTSCI